MATKKSKAKKTAAKAVKSKPVGKRPAPRERLAAFFRKLYKQPAMMGKFSSSAAGREQVLEKSDLTMEHRNLLSTGCLRDIIVALAGANCTMENCTIQCDNDGEGDHGHLCNHADCQAFRAATKQR